MLYISLVNRKKLKILFHKQVSKDQQTANINLLDYFIVSFLIFINKNYYFKA